MKKIKDWGNFNGLTKRQKAIILPILVAVGVTAIVLAIVAIVIMPQARDSKRGIAANGFTAFQEDGTTLGVDQVVSKDDVKDVLGTKAKSVGNGDVSKVFNYNGNRSQTVTYSFVRADGKTASVYVDVTQFKSTQAQKDTQIYTATKKTSDTKNLPTYYMHAQTLGKIREYRLMVVDGLSVYKFVMEQPYRYISINEVAALAALKKLAAKAEY